MIFKIYETISFNFLNIVVTFKVDIRVIHEGRRKLSKNLDELYHIYFNDVYYFLLSLCHHHYTAEDLLQETFFRAYLYLESYEGENVKTWLFTVAYRTFIDHYRKHKRVEVKEQGFFAKLFDKKQSPAESVVLQEEVQSLINMVKELPEKQQYAVILRDFHEFTYSEAAQIMDIQISYFKVLLFRGRQAVRKRKGEDES